MADSPTLTHEQVVAIMRDYGMHEPSCPKRQTEKAQRNTGIYLTPPLCECWLREDD